MCADVACLWIDFNDDPVLCNLLLDQDDLLNAFDHEVASGVVGALPDFGQLFRFLFRKPAITGTQHHWHLTNDDIGLGDNVVTAGILNIDVYWRAVGHVPDSTLLWCDLMHDRVFCHNRHAHIDISELEIEAI